MPKAEQILRTNIQPYINSILEALMDPTSRGFAEVRDVFFREMVEISKNSLNGGAKEKMGEVSAWKGMSNLRYPKSEVSLLLLTFPPRVSRTYHIALLSLSFRTWKGCQCLPSIQWKCSAATRRWKSSTWRDCSRGSMSPVHLCSSAGLRSLWGR